ncbi:MAG: transketolase, partial [Desulfobacteraceae bacterium]|nr:transketolase [Desulfobacteraceae bacterium]
KQGKEECHGSPLGEAEIALTRQAIGWPQPPFEIPDEIYRAWNAKARGQQQEVDWETRFARYQEAHPSLAAELERRLAGELPAHWQEGAAAFIAAVNAKAEKVATRKASQNALNGFGPLLPELIGGSADLAGSNLTWWQGSKNIGAEADGNYIHFGVREFGMAAIMNGLALHGGFIPYGATFLMFSEYARNALRMAALMKVQGIFVFTHDSIGLGEDGPTHQPVEQAATLRMIPNMQVWRPCDAVESAVAWRMAVERRTGPSSLLFSRQGLPHQMRDAKQIEMIERGGYVLADCPGRPQAVLIACGSEVALATQAAAELGASGCPVRVVSMPCPNLFDAQEEAYRQAVLPAQVPRVAIEAGVSDYWRKYVGLNGAVIGIDRFGESAPAEALFDYLGITKERLLAAVKTVISQG